MAENNKAEAERLAPGNPRFSRNSILRTIWKRKIRIGVAWVLITACALAIVRLLPAVYLSESLVLIDSQKIPEKFVSATVANDLEDRIASIRQTLLSSTELKKIIDDFGLYAEERKSHFEEEILEMMRTDVTITLEQVSSGLSTSGGGGIRAALKGAEQAVAFRIGYQGRDPQLVARVANRLTDLYVDENMKTREYQAAGTSKFLDTQLGEAKVRLDQLEATVSAYKLQHNGELPQQEAALGGALARLQTELEMNRDAINRAQQTKVILESNVNAMEATLAAQTRAIEEAQRSADSVGSYLLPDQQGKAAPRKTSEALQEQLEVLRGRYSDSHPDVVRMKADIEKVKKVEAQREAEKSAAAAESAKAASDSGAGDKPAAPVREPAEFVRAREQMAGWRAQVKGVDKDLEARGAEQQRILKDIDSYQKRIERLPVREQDMAKITRDYEMSKENYKSLQAKKMDAGMALDMERGQQSERFTVLDRARVPQKPFKPKRPQLYAAGAVIGMALALILGFVAEMRQDVILGEWELPEGTPILARLPFIEVPVAPGAANAKSRRWWFRRKKAAAAASVAALTVALSAFGNLHRL
jgi:polysaccharide biosynthesis transport protein